MIGVIRVSLLRVSVDDNQLSAVDTFFALVQAPSTDAMGRTKGQKKGC